MHLRHSSQQPEQDQNQTVAAFANSIMTEINAMAPDTSSDVFVHAESIVSVERLMGYLKPLSLQDTKPSSAAFGLLKNFLAQRWDEIKKTDAIYSHNPHSIINRVCLLLANKLSVYFNVHPFELLMPTVTGILDLFPDKTWDTLHLNEFIMRENDVPLGILDAFSLLEQASLPLADVRDCEHIPGNKRLSISEEGLLATHSDAAAAYYKVLCNRSSKQAERQEAKQRLVDFMQSLPESFTPKSTYDVSGKRRLARMIVGHIERRKYLVALFAHHIPRSEWRTFMAILSDKDYFRAMSGINVEKTSETEPDSSLEARRLILIENSIKQLLSPSANKPYTAYTEMSDILIRVEEADPKKAALRAYMYCLLHAYRRMRKAQPDVKSSISRYASSFFSGATFGVCTKEEKLGACDAIEKILLEKETLLDIYTALESDELRLHTAAIQDGQLGTYLAVIKLIIDRARPLEDPSRQHDWVDILMVRP